MNKNGIASKLLYNNTEEGIQTHIQILYNTHTDHIILGTTQFNKSHGFSNGAVTNKKCSAFLGVTIAEQVLFNVFNNVERMPYGNKGFDFICNHGYMIDVKSSTQMKTQNAWLFAIKRNQIPDYFLCLAFDDRKNLNPMHIWLIPSKEINHLKSLQISISTINKWSKYELSDKLDKVISCCNIIKGDN